MKLVTTFLPHLLLSSAIITGVIIHPFTNKIVYADENKKTEPEIPETVKNVSVRVEIHGVVNGKKYIQNGSGVIISRNGNTYTVLTSHHLLYSTYAPKGERPYVYDEEYQKNYQGQLFIVVNGVSHEVTDIKNNIKELRHNRDIGLDLALIRFTSQNDYPVAKLAFTAEELDPINIYGWPRPENPEKDGYQDRYRTTTIYRLENRPDYSGRSYFKGFTMSYDFRLGQGGISGGPVFDENEEFVIGIHGKGNGIYSEIPLMTEIFTQNYSITSRAAAIPINAFLDQLPNGSYYRPGSLFDQIDPEWLTDVNNSRITTQPRTTNNQNRAARKKYGEAVILMRAKKFSSAIELLIDLVDSDKNNYLARLALGDAYYQNGGEKQEAKNLAFQQYNEAEKILAQFDVEKVGSYKSDIILRRAYIFYDLKDYQSSQKELNKLKNKSEDAEILAYFINSSLINRHKNKEQAKRNLNDAIQYIIKEAKVSNSTKAFYLLAVGKEFYKAYYLEGDEGKKTAIKVFDQAIKLDPENVYTYLEIAKFLRLQHSDNKKIALEYFERLKQEQPENTEVLTTISEIYELDFQATEKAIEAANEAVNIDPQNPEVYLHRGNLLTKNQDNGAALKDFKQALGLFEATNNQDGARYVRKQICLISPEDCPVASPLPKQPSNNQPSQPVTTTTPPLDSTFVCDPNTSNLTLVTINGQQRTLIKWQSTAFTPSGYNPQIRCQHVSGRLQKFQTEGRLIPENITSSVVIKKIQKNGRWRSYSLNVLCLANSSSDAVAKRCAEDGLIITLERGEKPEQMLQQFRRALTENFTGETLIKDIKLQTKTVSEPQ